MKISAYVLEQRGAPLQRRELILRSPRADELIVKILSSGICHTDIAVQTHCQLPMVLGHEGVGMVEQCGPDVGQLKVGDLVALSFGYCGACRSCTDSQPAHCAQFPQINFSGNGLAGEATLQDQDGAPVSASFFNQSSFASHALVNECNAIRLPGEAPHRLLGPLGCGVQTGVGGVLNTLRVAEGTTLVCFGVGAVGLSAVMGGVLAGCEKIVAVDLVEGRLALAQELGATHIVDGGDDVVGAIHEVTDGGADYCLETVGSVETFHAALESVRLGGHVGLANVPGWVDGFHFQPMALGQGRTITGVVEGSSDPKTFIPQLYRWYVEGRLPIDRLITTYDFTDINTALDDLREHRTIKPVLLAS